VDTGDQKKITLRLLAVFALLSLVLQGCVAQRPNGQERAQPQEPVVIHSVRGDYDQVWDDLVMALNDRGLVVSSTSHVGEMLARTGKALARHKKIFSRAKVLEFCSALISRQMMEKNPHYIAFCPYQIMVYSLPAEPGRVYLAYRRLRWKDGGDREVLGAVETLLSDLIDEVVDQQSFYQE